MTAPATVWLASALRADRMLLLGGVWDELAGTLTHQGADVTAAPSPADLDEDSQWPAVAVDLRLGASALEAAVERSDGAVVTWQPLTEPTREELAARHWPLTAVRDAVVDDPPVWVALWQRGDNSHELTSRFAAALHLALQGVTVQRDRAEQAQRDAAREASEARRLRSAADTRARTTVELSNRWMSAQQAVVTTAVDAGAAPATGRLAETVAGTLADAIRSTGGAILRRRGGGPAAASETGSRPAALSQAGWRVAALDGHAADWLGDWVDLTVLPPGRVPDSLVAHVGGHLDVLVIGPVAEGARGAVRSLVEQARTAGAAVVGVRPGGEPWPGFDDLADVLLAGDPEKAGPKTLTAPAPFRPLELKPVGFRTAGSGLVTLVTSDATDSDAIRAAARKHADAVELIGPGGDRPLPWNVTDRASKIRNTGGVLDVPEAHTSFGEHARTLVGAAAAGIPIVSPSLPDAVADLLGPELAGAIRATSLTDLDDPHRRERRSVMQRRAAHWSHTIQARWRRLGVALGFVAPPRPSVSAVVVTNRPGHLDHCAEQLRRQTYRPLEVVLGVHGHAFGQPDIDRFRDRVGLPTTVVRIDGTRTLGEGLNEACTAASGTVVTKWDDDDWYGPDHVADLVLALEYSGATVVGKGSEFVHLDHLDITIRRFVGGAESGSRSLAGGTLALRKQDLAAIGWWRRIPRSVDQRLLDDVERAGGTIHRTHGYGFVLARRASGHTWAMDVDYFLGQAQAQWRGMAREIAGLDDQVLPTPAEAVPPIAP